LKPTTPAAAKAAPAPAKAAKPAVKSEPVAPVVAAPPAPAATVAKSTSKAKAASSKAAPKAVPEVAVAPAAPKPEPVRKSAPAPKPEPVIVKSVAPAAKFPAIDPDDEFVGIEKLTDPEFVGQQLVLLQQALNMALGQATMLRAEADQLAAEMEPGDVQFDDESGEGASASMEREKDLAMAAEKLLAAEDIERAIVRVHERAYGFCTNCYKPIPRPRLRALPQATLCIECKNGGLSRRS
jgi:DnaK suppressor protein